MRHGPSWQVRFVCLNSVPEFLGGMVNRPIAANEPPAG